MKNNIFLFSHQDDEIAVFKTIKDKVKKKMKIFSFFSLQMETFIITIILILYQKEKMRVKKF